MISRHAKISLPLQLTFLIFSMVLNCMGIVILQLSEAKIAYEKLGFLESFKDLPIAFISLFIVHFISRFGAKKSLMFSLSVVGICSLILPFAEVFWFYKLWFAIIGTCFAIGKICVFGILRNNVTDERSLAKSMNSVEASFMIGIFVVNTGFGWLISSAYSEFWKFGFLFISLLCAVTVFLFSRLQVSEAVKTRKNSILRDLTGLFSPALAFFLAIIFSIVFIEQSFNSWLPSFYKYHLKVNSFFALQASSFLALFSYAGRMLTAYVIHRFSLPRYYLSCLALILLVLSVISGIQLFSSEGSTILLFLFPVTGFFLAPLYPVINSKMISGIDRSKAEIFTALIVIFSSLGSSLSSVIMSVLFGNRLLDYYSLYILSAVSLLFIISVIYFKIAGKTSGK